MYALNQNPSMREALQKIGHMSMAGLPVSVHIASTATPGTFVLAFPSRHHYGSWP
jgi:hypothetical protein